MNFQVQKHRHNHHSQTYSSQRYLFAWHLSPSMRAYIYICYYTICSVFLITNADTASLDSCSIELVSGQTVLYLYVNKHLGVMSSPNQARTWRTPGCFKDFQPFQSCVHSAEGWNTMFSAKKGCSYHASTLSFSLFYAVAQSLNTFIIPV